MAEEALPTLSTPSQQHLQPVQVVSSNSYVPTNLSHTMHMSPVGGSQPTQMQSYSARADSTNSQPPQSFRQWLPGSPTGTQPYETLSQPLSQGSAGSGSQTMHSAIGAAFDQTPHPFTGPSQNFSAPKQAAGPMCNCQPPQVCVIRTAKTTRNLNRDFFACPKHPSQKCQG